MNFTKLNPFETEIEFPPSTSNPFTRDVELRIEASYYLSQTHAPDDPDEVRLDKVIRISDDADITRELTEDQREAIQVEALERIEEAESERTERNAGTHDDHTNDGESELPDATD